MLVSARAMRSCRPARPWKLGALPMAVALFAFACNTRLDAETKEPNLPDSPSVLSQVPEMASQASEKVFVCRVSDQATGKPIAAARVLIRLSAIDPTTRHRRTLAEIRQRTSADGTYRFVVTPTQLTEASLLIEKRGRESFS